MLRFPNNPAGRDARRDSLAGHLARRIRCIFALLVILAFLWAVGQSTAQQEAERDTGVESTPGSAAETVEETLRRIDNLLAQFDPRIEGIRARAEEMLEHADAAKNPDEQMRLEELYGRMMATAQGLEEQRSKLRQMRDELATSGDRTAP